MNYDGNGMLPDSQNNVLKNLRWLAASDPKQARAAFLALLQGQENALTEVLTSASRPGDGRLRQMIATVFRTDANATILEPWLRQWLEVESDEFTKAAIQSALTSRAPAVVARPASRSPALQTVETYRYVADRLCHRVRNALTLPSAQIKRLEHLIGEINDAAVRQELAEILAGFQTGFLRVSRNVEFDTGDDYLTWQTIPLVRWLESTANEFASRFGPAKHAVICDPAVRHTRVQATRFLLETIFGNLWSNAIQAADQPCNIEIQCALDSIRGIIDILVLDNGSGFPEMQLETAFQQVFSTKSVSRGRGLLEVADAVAKLQGTVELARVASDEYRIHILLPVESP